MLPKLFLTLGGGLLMSISGLAQSSVPATEAAEQQARKAYESELRNNVNAGARSSAKGSEDSTIYPKSARPDVEDSYRPSEAHRNTRKVQPTGSRVLDSFSGSSSLPEKTEQAPAKPRSQKR